MIIFKIRALEWGFKKSKIGLEIMTMPLAELRILIQNFEQIVL